MIIIVIMIEMMTAAMKELKVVTIKPVLKGSISMGSYRFEPSTPLGHSNHRRIGDGTTVAKVDNFQVGTPRCQRRHGCVGDVLTTAHVCTDESGAPERERVGKRASSNK